MGSQGKPWSSANCREALFKPIPTIPGKVTSTHWCLCNGVSSSTTTSRTPPLWEEKMRLGFSAAAMMERLLPREIATEPVFQLIFLIMTGCSARWQIFILNNAFHVSSFQFGQKCMEFVRSMPAPRCPGQNPFSTIKFIIGRVVTLVLESRSIRSLLGSTAPMCMAGIIYTLSGDRKDAY